MFWKSQDRARVDHRFGIKGILGRLQGFGVKRVAGRVSPRATLLTDKNRAGRCIHFVLPELELCF
jgi:hypothetical protein